jgi:hypothetical protein
VSPGLMHLEWVFGQIGRLLVNIAGLLLPVGTIITNTTIVFQIELYLFDRQIGKFPLAGLETI